ncbi:MAG: DUF1080 domain-containing protein [Acidobacteriota bacterium]
MRDCAIVLALALACLPLAGQNEPQPRVVTPAETAGQPSSDAVVLFDGKDTSEWTLKDGKPVTGCTVENGAMVCQTGAGDIYSKRQFRDAQIHLEWMEPSMPEQHSQARGNSGVYLQGRYEIQVLDSYQNPTYPDGACGALYGQAPPLVNACRPAGRWQSYDIVFHPHKCGPDGRLLERGSLTVFQNGILIQDHVTIHNIGRGCIEDKIGEPGPLMLQDHNYPGAPHTVMRFRNIWYRPLDESEMK